MATVQFKSVSPYTVPIKGAPSEDYLYAEYERDVNQDLKQRSGKQHGLAIFGLGRAGSIHLSNIVKNDRIKLLYIVDDVTSKWDGIKKYWNLTDTKFLTSKDAGAVYEDSAVDVVIVTSPTFTHEDIVTKSLAAKKAVFCEKPIAEDAGAAMRCYEKAEKVKKPLFCAFNRRFDSSYSAVRDRVRKGDVGHVQVIKVCARDSPLPSIEYLKTSGGIFHDCIVHDIDMATWILGELPMKVQASAAANIPEIKAIDDFDCVVTMLTFPSGTIAVLDNSRYCNYGYDQRLEVFGPKGMIRADNERPNHCNEIQLGQSGSTIAPIWHSFASRFKRAYAMELEHFLDVVDGKVECMVKKHQVYAISKIASAAEESARSGRVIDLNWSKEDLTRQYA